MIKYFVMRNFRDTCLSVKMLKGYIVRERLGTSVLVHVHSMKLLSMPNNKDASQVRATIVLYFLHAKHL